MSNHAFNCLLAKVMIVPSDAGFSYFKLEMHHNVCGFIMFEGTWFTQGNIFVLSHKQVMITVINYGFFSPLLGDCRLVASKAQLYLGWLVLEHLSLSFSVCLFPSPPPPPTPSPTLCLVFLSVLRQRVFWHWTIAKEQKRYNLFLYSSFPLRQSVWLV